MGFNSASKGFTGQGTDLGGGGVSSLITRDRDDTRKVGALTAQPTDADARP